MKEDTVPEQPTYVRVTARALRELTEAVNAANLDVAKLHHRLTADGCYVPDHPLYEPLALHGPLSWTDDLAKASAAPQSDRTAEGFSNPRAASSRKVRSAVMALQYALGVGEDGIVGPATMQAIEGIRAGGDDERVMVRAVLPLRVLIPIVTSDHTRTFVLDAASTGHRGQFRPGDLVVQAEAFDAIQRVIEVADDVEGTFCREIHLVVKRADVVVDADAV